MTDTRTDEAPWPLRALVLMAVGALAGLAIHLLLKGARPWELSDSPLRIALAALIGSGSIAFAFALERARWVWSLAFALLVGLVIGLVTWSNGPPYGWGANERWQLFAAALAVAIALPLFQTARDADRLRFDYQRLHSRSWTNIVLWCAAWGFTLVAWLLAQLLAELFNLIGIHLLHDLLRDSWFNLMLVGGAFGLAAGLFRDRDRVLETLQRVVTAILAVLTPVLAAGLVLFVLSLPFTGIEPLWSQTKQTTPILLTCILGAFLLVNATIGPDEEPRPAWLRHSAMGLGAVMLPLGIVAALSLARRIGQYGVTPDRLWAAVFVAIALAAGLLYLVAILRRRLLWSEDVRGFNIALALGTCGLALLLALPILSFGAISAHSQVARLESGRVAPDKFDWAALRFDFGPAGRRAAERLARAARQPESRRLAAAILSRGNRYDALEAQQAAEASARPRILAVIPSSVAVPEAIRTLLYASGGNGVEAGICSHEGSCVLKWQPGDKVAIATHDRCGPYPSKGGAEARGPCGVEVRLLELEHGQWRQVPQQMSDVTYLARGDAMAQDRALRSGRVDIRTVQARQVYIDGRPVSYLFEPEPSSK